MKCCAIKLATRTAERQSPFQKTGHRYHPGLLENNDYARLSLSDTTRSEQPTEDDRPYLSVLNIILPNGIKAFNTGSSIRRWANKRPRLRSARTPDAKDDHSADSDLDSLDVSNLIRELQDECEEERQVLDSNGNEEVHPDIQRLLSATSEGSERKNDALVDSKRISFDFDEKSGADDGAKRKPKRRHKKKSKDGNKEKEKAKSKKKLTKTVSFSISKPPTPQTEQVIRVDVISNYSVEFPVESNRTDAMSSDHSKVYTQNVNVDNAKDGGFLFQIFCTEKQEEGKDFIVESKKAVLFPRIVEK